MDFKNYDYPLPQWDIKHYNYPSPFPIDPFNPYISPWLGYRHDAGHSFSVQPTQLSISTETEQGAPRAAANDNEQIVSTPEPQTEVDDELTCVECGKQFNRVSSLKLHIERQHMGIGHPCGICGKEYTTKWQLNAHIKAQHEGIRHSCGICKKEFNYKPNLKHHIKLVHEGFE